MSFYRRRGRSLSVSAKALAGVSAEIRGRDLLAALMKAISPNPEADLLTLVDAGLDDRAIEAIQQAVAASIDRSLTLSAQFQLSALREDEALFSYDVELSRLDQAGKAAVGDAMHGRLAAIGQAADAANGPIRLVASAAKQLRERKTSWRINVLGILNIASFVELVREGSVTFDPVSGTLTAADKVSARRIRIKEKPFESDSEKLRKVLFESVMVTAAYQASRALGSTVSLTADHTYLEQRGRTKRTDLEDHYRALIALGLCDARERDARLATEAGVRPFDVRHREPLRRGGVRRDVSRHGRAAARRRALRANRAAGLPGADSRPTTRRGPSAGSRSNPTSPGRASGRWAAPSITPCRATSATRRSGSPW